MLRTIIEKYFRAPTSHPCHGWIDSFEGYVAAGWFIDPATQAGGGRFKLFLDQHCLGTYAATLPRQDIHVVAGVLLAGFSIDLRPAVSALPAGLLALDDGQPHQLSLRDLRDIVVAEKRVGGHAPLHGFLERCTPRGISGWAVNLATPDAPVELDVFADGIHFCTLRTDTPRPDVIAENFPGRCAGFSQAWPASMFPLGAEIDVRHRTDGSSLHNSPVRLPPRPQNQASRSSPPGRPDASCLPETPAHPQGSIDTFDGRIATGWFIDSFAGADGHRFRLFLNDHPLGVFEAAHPPRDAQAPAGTRHQSFSADLRAALRSVPPKVLAGDERRSYRLSLRTMQGIVVTGREVSEVLSVRHVLERCDHGGLAGWVVTPSADDGPVQLDVYADGNWFCAVTATQPRPDLQAAGFPPHVRGFRQDWPPGLFAQGAEIDVRFADGVRGSGASLGNSPVRLPAQRSPLVGRLVDTLRTEDPRPVAIIVPVFNAFDAVRECLESIRRWTAPDTALLLIDDASTDERIPDLLRRHARPNTRIHRNPTNLGYTRSVNQAIAMVPDHDVVLLNSDTEVTEQWLDRLRYCAYSSPKVATVTPLTDTGGPFSAFDVGARNAVPAHLEKDEFARLVAHAGEGKFLEVPTGNGFCMYMRRRAIDVLGVFDEVRFPRGYGEENDFCMRAVREGWTNLVTDKAIIFHKQSQSFGEAKHALMKAGLQQMAASYPEYAHLTRRFSDPDFLRMRHRVRSAASECRSPPLRRILFVISTTSGGTPQTNMDLMQAMAGRYQCWLLRCDSRTLTLSELVGNDLKVHETHALDLPINPSTHRSVRYDRLAGDILFRYSISLLHIRHIAWHGLGLAAAARALSIPVVYSVHDFYAVCPSLKLLDNQLQYCGGTCTSSPGQCDQDLWPASSMPALKHAFVYRWREMFGAFLDLCDRFITTSSAAAETFLTAYPRYRDRLHVIPHGRDFEMSERVVAVPDGGRIRVLVPGNINAAKGGGLLAQISRLDTAGRIELHFLGKVSADFVGVGIQHGPYARDTFMERVREIDPHLGVILSVWPETWCHTLTEMWACGLPVLALDTGAVGERLRASGAGWRLPVESSPQQILDVLYRLADNAADLANAQRAVLDWQRGEGTRSDTATMGYRYRNVYRALLPSRNPAPPPRIGMVIKGGHAGPHPPTAHIRLLRTMGHLSRTSAAEPAAVDAAWILAGKAEPGSALILQRDALPAEQVPAVLRHLQHHGTAYVYEIDDLLWDLPGDHHDHAIDEHQRNNIVDLIRGASVVTTSTESLATQLRAYNPEVVVIENAYDPLLWRCPLPEHELRHIVRDSRLDDARERILYMGSRSHAGDLDMIHDAIRHVTATRPDCEIVQIGGGRLLPGARQLVVPATCSAYPEFVIWFRAICTRMNLALAPLRDTAFNRAKSDMKMLDYALAGVPGIYSRVGPYAESVHDGSSGLLTGNTTAEWVSAIDALMSDPDLRQRIASAADAAVAPRTIQRAATEWMRVLHRLGNADAPRDGAT